MQITVDSAGRIMIPKAMRSALGIGPGAKVDVSQYGGGLSIVPQSLEAQLERDRHGFLVIGGETAVTDQQIFALRDEFRR
jgi:AbrB family looped-hinge helix DNA binding protein